MQGRSKQQSEKECRMQNIQNGQNVCVWERERNTDQSLLGYAL